MTADREAALEPEHLERLAIAAHLIGLDETTDVWAPGHHKQQFISLLCSWQEAEEVGYAIVGRRRRCARSSAKARSAREI